MKYAAILLLFFFLLKPVAGWAEDGKEMTDASSKTEISKQSNLEPEKNLVDFFSFITDLSKRFVDLESQIDESSNLSRFQSDLLEISDSIQVLSRQVSAISTHVETDYNQFEFIKPKIYKLGYQIKKVKTPLFEIIENLSRSNTEWAQKREALDLWTKNVEDQVSFQLIKEDIITHQKKVSLALELISEKLSPALSIQKESFELEIKIHSLTLDIEKLTKLFQKKSVNKRVSVFSSDFYSQMNKDLLVTIGKNAAVTAVAKRQFFVDNFNDILVLCLVIFILSIFIHLSKKRVKASMDWYSFAERPLTSAVFLCMICLSLANFFTESDVQIVTGWEKTWRIILLVTIVRLSGALLAVSWKKSFIYLIIISAMVIEFFKTLNLPQAIFYLNTFFVVSLILIFCLWQSWHLSRQKISFDELLGLRLSILMLSGIFVVAISGLQDVAIYLFESLQAVLTFAFICWLTFIFTKSLLELLLLTIPLPLAQRNSSVIVKQLKPVILVFFFYVVLIQAVQFLGIYPTQEAAMKSFYSFNLSAGAWMISPGTLFSAGVTLYIILLISKAIQGLLLQEVFPRYQAAKGVQFSVVRLVNYAILSFGFFLLLHVLGFELQSLTIFGSALGIGIGFGLQTIVANVASGLILLFERPIKVGDMIQVNSEFGEIKKLGLRATVVETFDNAEIVIPNSDLVTGQVTNWTLAERRVRVKIPVGVAYGTDTTKVLEILMRCADESPMVLSNPPPQALFLSFGESSLDFELRVWIPEFNDRMIAHSELNQQINDEFKRAGVEIPFPQRDLHLYGKNEAQ